MKLSRASGGFRFAALAMTGIVLVAGCTATGASHSAAPTTPTAATAATVATLDDLRSGGLLIVPSEVDAAQPTHGQLLVTQVQADRMLAELAGGGGVIGSAIDGLAPMPSGAPPMSYLIAGWVTGAGTPTAAKAARLMGEHDWTHAPSIVFPTAVLAMFVSDMAKAVDASAPTDVATSAGATDAVFRTPSRAVIVPAAMMAPVGGPCSAVTDFLASTINGLFDALRLTAPSGGILSVIASVPIAVWNAAVGLAKGVVTAVANALTAPVFEVMRVAIGALGVATSMVSYLKDQQLIVSLDPRARSTDTYHFAIGAEADVHGEFVATAKSLTGDWPPALKDCAKVSGATLPELIAVGGNATWVVVDNEDVITPGALNAQVRSDRSAHLSFVTGRESDEQAKGEARFDVAVLRADIPRKELATFLDFAQDQIAGVRNQILSKIPQADLRNFADAKLGQVLDPTVKQLRSEAESLVGGVFTLSGTGVVVVKHHNPPEPSPSPSPSASTNGFCAQYVDMARWAHDHQGMDSKAWAGEIVRRLTAMRPLAPAALAADVGVIFDVYTLVANEAGGAAIGNAVAEGDFPGAAQRVGVFCKVDPSLFTVS